MTQTNIKWDELLGGILLVSRSSFLAQLLAGVCTLAYLVAIWDEPKRAMMAGQMKPFYVFHWLYNGRQRKGMNLPPILTIRYG